MPAGFGQGRASFATALYAAGPNASYIAVGKFNKDNFRDFAVGRGTVRGVTIMLAEQLEDGGIVWRGTSIDVPPTSAIAVGDVNGDEALDLVLALPGENGCRILVNDGSGSFVEGAFIQTGNRPTSVSVGDLNEDGLPDIVAAGSDVSIVLGSGNGTFGQPVSYSFGFSLHGLVVADFDGDGHLDVAAYGQGVAEARFEVGDGRGHLVAASIDENKFDAGGYITSLVAADVDRDGHVDLVATALQPTPAGSTAGVLSILLNSGAGATESPVRRFKAPNLLFAGTSPVSVAVADVDGDGYPDYAIACAGDAANPGLVRVMLGDGAGGTTAETDLPLPLFAAPSAIVAADLTADNQPDLIVSEPSINDVALLVNMAVFDLPVAEAGPDRSTTENALVLLDGSDSHDSLLGDKPPDKLTYEWAQTGGPLVELSGADAMRATFLAPRVGRSGATLTFQLIVSNGTTTSKPDLLNIFVANVDQPPIANAGADQKVPEGATVQLDGSRSSDPDHEDLSSYSWVQTAGTSVLLSDPTSAAPTFVAPPPSPDGTPLVFALTVSSFGLFSTADSVNIRINRPPVAAAGPDQTVDEGLSFFFDGTGSDLDGDPLTCNWIQIAGPAVTLVADGCAASATAPLVQAGGATLTFQLDVSDGLATASDSVDVIVKNVNHAPIAQATAVPAVNEGSNVTLDGSGSYDLDGEALSYVWAQTAGPRVMLSDVAASTPTFVAPSPGYSVLLTFALSVNDGIENSKIPASVNVLVEHLNHPPAADAGEDQTVDSGTRVTLHGGGTDPDGDQLSYMWMQTGGTAVALDQPRSANVSFIAPTVTGPLVFRLDVSDGPEMTSDSVVVTVRNRHDPPACTLARPSVPVLWPPNHKLIPISINGVADPTGENVAITITTVTQDEPVAGLGDGDTAPDAVTKSDKVLLRAERTGRGNGRVYSVNFTANDAEGGVCNGTVRVVVPLSMKAANVTIDDGQKYDSTSGSAVTPKNQ